MCPKETEAKMMNDDEVPSPPDESNSGHLSPPKTSMISSLQMDEDVKGDPVDERKQVKDAMRKFQIQVGGKYNLIEANWFRNWKEWCCYDDMDDEGKDGAEAGTSSSGRIISRGDRPPPIDNISLFEENSTTMLLRDIKEGVHYEFISPQAWALLQGWYEGGPAAMRRGISRGRDAVVELHGLTVNVLLNIDKENVKELHVSNNTTVRELKELIMELFDIKGKDVRLWEYYQAKPLTLLDTPSLTMRDHNILEKQQIVVELPDEQGMFKIQKPFVVGSSSGATIENMPVGLHRPDSVGVCGLSNLGNTCFMNSTLQCLSNTPPLRDYFATGRFVKDINRSNPLGHEGKLAESFGNLLQLMWPESLKEATSCVNPKGFKYQMGRFRPEFQGYQQHDSSELMNFLLDGLHEDLNRIIDKPYTEAVENDGKQPDDEMARIFLEQHMKRNDSFIHDLFRGQFKSTLVCPCCGNVSITFDPYTMVSLPLTSLEQDKVRHFNVVLFRKSDDGYGRHMEKLTVTVAKVSTGMELRAAVAAAANLDLDHFVLTTVLNHKVNKVVDNCFSLNGLTSYSELVAHEVEESKIFIPESRTVQTYGYIAPPAPKDESIYSAITIFFRERYAQTYTYYLQSRTKEMTRFIGKPLLMCHPKETNQKALYEAIAKAIGQKVNKGQGEPLVLAEHIDLYVAQRPDASVVELNPISRDDDTPIHNGMHAKLCVVIEFNDAFHEQMTENPTGISDLKRRGGYSADGKKAEEETDDKRENDGAKKELKIDDCFDLFETPETLSVEDAWYCGKCKDHVQATKQMELWSTPDVLVLHLKRFISHSRWNREKLSTPVDFPLDNFDVSRFIKGPKNQNDVYDCVAVSNHMGTLSGGHYTASARGADNNWYKFNDSNASRMNESAVVSDDVYLLFYVRKSKLAEYEMSKSS